MAITTNDRTRIGYRHMPYGGALYEYTNVDPDLYDNLCKAESIGKFFNEKIKNNFEHIQLLTD